MTGMSGTGKSIALERLRLLGFRTVDTDEGDWTVWSETEDGYVWREGRIAELLAGDEGPSLYVSGTVSNQGLFCDRFDAVLLSAPADVLLSRIDMRTTNSYGKTPHSGSLCCATWQKLSRFCVGRAPTKSMPLSRLQTSLPNSRNSVTTVPLRSTCSFLARRPCLGAIAPRTAALARPALIVPRYVTPLRPGAPYARSQGRAPSGVRIAPCVRKGANTYVRRGPARRR